MKKLPLGNQNLINLDTKSFISFMENPSSVSRILQEHTEISKRINTEGSKSQEREKTSGDVKLIDFLCGFGKTITNSLSSDTTKFLCMVHPTSDKLYEFWNMILKTGSRVIAVLAAEDEVNNQYWRPDADVKCKEIRIKIVRIVMMDSYRKTTLQLKQDGEVKEVVHLHYTKWPLDNISHCPSQLIKFISIVNSISAEDKTDQGAPIVVQCNDGAKSSVFCLLEMCISEFRKSKVVSVAKVLLKMRQTYGSGISEPEDYLFCYNALYHFVTKYKN
ncbi:tyrosine-protein phosphatase non-receptor type 1-like [Cydia pomonella]|uniref:tyrosine-protein phosphatase non-receptor type 1-like n=1 Tax=Cydia pomonella TaxID=82600 RepID=UPI002ADDD7BC|nr:tyrosine-protein phosphatase non-receptor type 1-like [Cydia pomonella]